MTRDIDTEILLCRSQLAEISIQAETKRAELSDLLRLAAEIVHGVKVGSIVVHQGKRFTVSSIETNVGGFIPWIYGYSFKKDGTPSKVKRCLYTYWSVES